MEHSDLTNLEEKIEALPLDPGVYMMKDKKGAIIYIGKAKNLRNRVKSYFGKTIDPRFHIKFLIPKVVDVETIITNNEKEALILENLLIKKHKPVYNIELKDDKTYVSLKLTIHEEFPRLQIVRRFKNDGSRYFGPYSSASAVRETLNFLDKIFPLRKCSNTNFKKRLKPCFYHQIGRCAGPCCRNITRQDYAEGMKEIVLFLEGKNQELIKKLEVKMKQEAKALNFEEAARLRDQIAAIKKTLEKQKMVISGREDLEQDILGIYREEDEMAIGLLFIRNGILQGTKVYSFSLELPTEEILSSFLKQFYNQEVFIPREILIPTDIEEREILQLWLTEKKGEEVSIIVPEKEDELDLVVMAAKNAKQSLEERKKEKERSTYKMEELKEELHLRKLPHRIECFDISNLGGKLAVGSMVVFKDGQPAKDCYRRFRIKTLEEVNDYGMMFEVLSRRFKEGTEELPDLIVVDGGKGQLNVALKVLKEKKLEIDAIGLAKEGSYEGAIPEMRKGSEKVYLPRRKEPILFKKNSSALLFLQRIRDEAHRFAIEYHKTLRKKKGFSSTLENIPGIGQMKARHLLRYFGSIESIKKASLEQLYQVPKITRKEAQNIYQFFRQEE